MSVILTVSLHGLYGLGEIMDAAKKTMREICGNNTKKKKDEKDPYSATFFANGVNILSDINSAFANFHTLVSTTPTCVVETKVKPQSTGLTHLRSHDK